MTLFRIRTFSWGNLAAAAIAAGEFALVFMLPLYLITPAGSTRCRPVRCWP